MKYLKILLVLIAAGINTAAAEAPEGPGLGVEMDNEELLRYDIGVMPDGRGLPAGSGSVEEGEALYQQKCLVCHGAGGVGNTGEQLAGAINQLTDEWPEKTIGTYWPYATTLFDFTRRSMPMTQPGSLTDDETYALVAYMLYLNQLVDADAVMDAEAVQNFQMPNRDGFVRIHPLSIDSE